MVALTAFSLGAAGQVMPGRLLRHTVGGLLRPAAAGLQVVSGCLAGPPNTQGELALVSNTQLTVQPFRAVIQNSQDLTAGAYLVPSETVQTFTAGGAAGQTIPAQDASQFRRALVTLHVDDAQVAGSGGNASTLEVLPGALAATAGAAVLPATPANALNLGELLIPPTGQTVTLTPYNPRTSTRGAILPVIADGTTIAGHDGALPTFDGQARWHPTRGLELASGGQWGSLLGGMARAQIAALATAGVASASTWTTVALPNEIVDTHGGHGASDQGYVVPAGQGGTYLVEAAISFSGLGNPAVFATRIVVNEVVNQYYGHGAYIQSFAGGAGIMPTGSKLLVVNAGDTIKVQGYGGTIWQPTVDVNVNRGVTSQMTLVRVA